MASAKGIQLQVVTAEGSLFSGVVAKIQVTASEGDIEVYPRHAPLLTSLRPGILRIVQLDGVEDILYSSGGFMEVQPHLITLLADTAVRGSELDETQVVAATREAQQKIGKSDKERDMQASMEALTSALAKLRAIRLTHNFEVKQRQRTSMRKPR